MCGQRAACPAIVEPIDADQDASGRYRQTFGRCALAKSVTTVLWRRRVRSTRSETCAEDPGDMGKRSLVCLFVAVMLALSTHVFGHDHAKVQAAPDPDRSTAATLALPTPGEPADVAAHHHGADPDEEVAGTMTMRNPGLPWYWIALVAIAMATIAAWSVLVPGSSVAASRPVNLTAVPVIGGLVGILNASPYPLLFAKIVSVAVYIVVVIAGIFGTPYPERNLATVLVWNLWWPLVVVAVLFLGSAWCGVCPWDSLASWIVRHRFFRRAIPHPGLNLRVPPYLHNVWAALVLFLALTWLELGADVSTIPSATAALALIMLLLSVAFLLVFERKAFCRYACPVGRTLGFYSRLAPVALRPSDQATCDRCRTLESFKGSKDVEPCPSHLTMGGLKQNTYCVSCGNCVFSCPHGNVSWQLRPMGTEARERARPKADEAWFMLALLGITTFHGFTMMPFWDEWVTFLAHAIGEHGNPIGSFPLSMLAALAAPVAIYAVAVGWTCLATPSVASYRQIFTGFAFVALPLAFAYHVAHNLGHLVRESGDIASVAFNPMGAGLGPLSAMEKHSRMMSLLLPEPLLFAAQAGLFVLGFWLATRIAQNRVRELLPGNGYAATSLLPMLTFAGVVTALNVWLTAQDMVMRF